MDTSHSREPLPEAPTFLELFTPKLITVFREGYGLRHLRADVLAGLTVAIVALPLSMAIAIASGVSPERGLYTAIVGGFIVSAMGGSRFQVGGPAGAFIVLVAATVTQHGLDGLLLATMMSGVMLLAIGFLRLGTYVKYIPYPVTVGFTAGIAVIIFASQIREIFGLALPSGEPGPLVPKIAALWAAAGTVTPTAVAIALTTIAVIAGVRKLRSGWPGMLIAVALAGLATWLGGLPVETIGTRFGGIPAMLPTPALPDISGDKLAAVLPNALAFALLGAIESLLSAVVADGMTGRRHRSNCELTAQGVANIASGLFGGICVTGTIARTVTNVRAGAHGPVAGMVHSLFVLVFLLVAAPLAQFVPLAALAGVLAVVAWNMVEKHAFLTLLRMHGDAVVLMATFLLTVFRDLSEGILVGFGIGTLLFMHRMAKQVSVEQQHMPQIAEDRADTANGDRRPYDSALATAPDVIIYRISGAFFFGAAATVGAVLDRVAGQPRTLVLDFTNVSFLDSTGANTIAIAARKAERAGSRLIIAGAAPTVRRTLKAHGVGPPHLSFRACAADVTSDDAIKVGTASSATTAQT